VKRSFVAAAVLSSLVAALLAPMAAIAADATPDTTKAAPPGMSKAAPPDSVRAQRAIVQVISPPDSTLVAMLRQGNYVLLLRHAATDWGQRDAEVVNYADRAAQRNLSAIGRAQADSIGKAVSSLGLKIGKVLTSPMYRCRDTAEIAFGRADTTQHLFIKSKPSRDLRVKWLSTPLADGALFVLVTHQDPYIPLFNFQRDQLKEGDALLIQPNGNSQWKLVAQLTPADWARLAARFGK
jgi:hypothetical protein